MNNFDKGNFKILVINFQSILNKKPDLLALISTENPDILAGTETWLTPDVTTNEIIPPEFGYNIRISER